MKKLSFRAVFNDGSTAELVRKEGSKEVFYTLPASCFSDKETVEISCSEFNRQVGDEGYYVIPGNEHTAGTAIVRFEKRDVEKNYINVDHPSLGFMATVLSDATYVVMIDRTYLYHLTVNYNGGAYRTSVRIVSGAQPVVDDVIIRVLTLPVGSDYNDVARAVRNYRTALGEIKPLSEKCRERAELEYARKYPLIRIRMGWKPVPPDVEHQTTENEPPMHVACTFRRVRELADKMKEICHGLPSWASAVCII